MWLNQDRRRAYSEGSIRMANRLTASSLWRNGSFPLVERAKRPDCFPPDPGHSLVANGPEAAGRLTPKMVIQCRQP
jgi:hypothetical protein